MEFIWIKNVYVTMNHTIITYFWPVTNTNQILGLQIEEFSSLKHKLLPNQTLTDSVFSCCCFILNTEYLKRFDFTLFGKMVLLWFPIQNNTCVNKCKHTLSYRYVSECVCTLFLILIQVWYSGLKCLPSAIGGWRVL